MSTASTDSIDPKLLDILVCPKTRSRLVYEAEAKELISPAAALAYPIRDGVPIMLIDEARPLTESERAKYPK
ncbi:MAG: Trm112 family protein [Pseudomonadota bacterium]